MDGSGRRGVRKAAGERSVLWGDSERSEWQKEGDRGVKTQRGKKGNQAGHEL